MEEGDVEEWEEGDVEEREEGDVEEWDVEEVWLCIVFQCQLAYLKTRQSSV